MDGPTADDVVAITSKVAGYGGAIASVFTNYSISAKKIPRGLEGAVNILNATIATLQQVSNHLKTETASATDEQRQLLSRQGLEYVQLLATECASTFVKISSIVTEACLDRKELKAKRKLEKKSRVKRDGLKVDIDALKLDKAAFTEAVENGKWIRVSTPLEDVMERLHEIQLHLLLVHQVVSLGELSWIGSSNQVDVKSVVAYHERVLRTAGLIGIKPPGQKNTSSRSSRYTSSDSDGLLSSSDSYSDTDSDDSGYKPKNSKKPPFKSTPPPPPPPGFRAPPPPANWAGAPPPPPPPRTMPALAAPGQAPIIVLPSASSETANPPAYSVAQRPAPLVQSTNSGSSTVQAIVTGSTKPVITGPPFPPEKEATKEGSPDVKEATTSAPLEPRLFKSKSNGLGFKIKTFFRSKDSLAEEMKKALSDSDSHLRAFVLRGHETRLVPHSAFHTLEATHMRTILSQLNDNTWYKTFTTLNHVEHQTMERLMHPYAMGKMHERDVVVLKVLEENKPSAWMVLLRDLLKSHPARYRSNDRVILAIMREKLLDGKPLPLISLGIRGMPPPPPPPPGFGGPPPPPPIFPIRPPPGPPNHLRTTRVSDLALPAPHLPLPSTMPCLPLRRGPPGPPPPPTVPNFGTKSITRLSDTRPLTDNDAALALTTYTSYTLRALPIPNPNPNSVPNPNPSFPSPHSWSRASVAQENEPHTHLHNRILSSTTHKSQKPSIIETKLRLSEHQNRQLTRVMDELRAYERDAARFEWCWAEISLYGDVGEVAVESQRSSEKATTMFAVAKRALRGSCKALEVYNSLMAAAGTGQMRMPLARPPLPPSPPPPMQGQRPVIVTGRSRTVGGRMKKKGGRIGSDSDSDSEIDSDSSLSSDSVRGLRMALRRDRKRKMGKKNRGKIGKGKGRRGVGSDSDESGIESEEDGVRVKVELKRGDDVAKALLDLWTPQGEVHGKGKANMAV